MTAQPSVIFLSVAVRGRIRARVEGLRHRPDVARRIVDRLAIRVGIREVHANPLTGSVLVLFDAEALSPRQVAAELRRYRDGGPPRRRSRPPTRGGDHEILERDGDRWHATTAADVVARLATLPSVGLTGEEAEARLARFGSNRVPAPTPRSGLAILAGQVTSLPVALLAGAAGLSLVSGAPFEAIVILGVVAANALVGYATESRVEGILSSLQRLTHPVALVRRDGRERTVSTASLVPGDVLILRAGHDVGADGRLVDVTGGLSVNESALTGEGLPVAKRADHVHAEGTPLADRANMVYAGTVVSEGAGLAVVTGTGSRTEFGRVRALVAGVEPPPAPIERQLDRMGRTLVGITVSLCAAVLGLGLLRGISALEMVRTAIALGVAAVPEGLPAVATTTFALGMQRMLRRNVLVRRLEVVESLGATTVICVDKTGTITENRMTVQEWRLPGGTRIVGPVVSGGNAAGDPLPGGHRAGLASALVVAVLCNEAELVAEAEGGTILGSGTEVALLESARALGVDGRALRARHPRIGVRPRAVGQNWMATVHSTDNGHRLIAVKGAPEEVLRLASHVAGRNGDSRVLTASDRRAILGTNARMASDALRVLGLAYRDDDGMAAEPPAIDQLVWAGLVGMVDPIRPGVREALNACRAAGIRVVMLTGDQSPTAIAVGRALGLDRNGELRVAEAAQIAQLPPEALRGLAREVDIFARVSPADKYRIVQTLQADDEVVAMTGDGINDGPALRAADVGVAIGVGGTELARDLADVVLLDDNIGSIVGAVEQGRTIRANVRKAVRFLLATNLGEVLLTVVGMALGIARPLTAVQLLWMNLLSDVFPALALAMEPAEPDVMRRAPGPRDEPLLSTADMRRIAVDAAVMTASALGAHAIAGGRPGAAGSTVPFVTLTTAQLLYALACRSETRPALSGLSQNPPLIGALAGTLALQVGAVTVPALRRLLGTSPLGAGAWGVVAAGAVAPLLAREMLKSRPAPGDAGRRPGP